MFEDNIFETWLDTKSKEIIAKLGDKQSLSSEEMIVLVLKAQTNHFAHLDMELRTDMKNFREDIARDMKEFREDMNRRFEQVDKRFEGFANGMRWQMGVMFAMVAGIYLKLFLG